MTEALKEYHLDFFCVTETWLLQSDIGIVSAALPDNYSMMSVCRPEGRGGGVALICTLSISNIKQIPRRMDVVSFEYMEISFCWRRRCFRLVVVYRPGHPGTDVDFLREFGSLLEVLLTLNGELLILGDFNYWIDHPHLKPYTTEFLELLDLYLTNQVSDPTHVHGHTLDLLLTPGIWMS